MPRICLCTVGLRSEDTPEKSKGKLVKISKSRKRARSGKEIPVVSEWISVMILRNENKTLQYWVGRYIADKQALLRGAYVEMSPYRGVSRRLKKYQGWRIKAS